MTAPNLPEPLALFDRAATVAAGVLSGLASSDLDRATPCDEYDVGTLVGHLVGVANRVAAVGRGGTVFDAPQVAEGLDPASYVITWRAAVADAISAWSPERLAAIIELPWATVPGAATVAMWTSEITVHAWDIAVATGQHPAWDEGVVAASLATMQMALPRDGRIEEHAAVSDAHPDGPPEMMTLPFAEVVDTPEGAPLIDRLVAWTGRSPSWRPTTASV